MIEKWFVKILGPNLSMAVIVTGMSIVCVGGFAIAAKVLYRPHPGMCAPAEGQL